MRVIAVPAGGDLSAVASAVCEAAQPGAVMHLVGPIGAGKTTLVQACARLLDVVEPVTSPTFALAHVYAGRMPVAHLDLYRLDGQPQRDHGELLAAIDEETVTFVEWPEFGAAWLPPPTLVVRIDVAEAGERRFHLAAPSA